MTGDRDSGGMMIDTSRSLYFEAEIEKERCSDREKRFRNGQKQGRSHRLLERENTGVPDGEIEKSCNCHSFTVERLEIP